MVKLPGKARLLAAAALLASAAVSRAEPAAGQSTLQRTPNLAGGWVGLPSTLYVDFTQRFDTGATSENEVGNTSTFLVGWGVGGYGLLGVHYSNASPLDPELGDEWEVVFRLSPLSTEVGAALDFSLTAAWNETAESFDGELYVGVPWGPVEAMGVVRGFSDGFGEEDSRWVVGAGARLRIHRNLALVGDLVRPFELKEGEEFAWGAGLQVDLPASAASLSLQATSTTSPTLQGSSLRAGGSRLGFQVAIPVSRDQLFGGRDPAARAGTVDLVADNTVRVAMTDSGFSPERVVVAPGTYVLWVNESGGVHSATAIEGSWASPFLAPGESYGRIFSEPGEHRFRSGADPSMVGTVVVQPRSGGRSRR